MSVADSPTAVHRTTPRPLDGSETAAGTGVLHRGVDWEQWSRPGPTRKQQANDVWIGLAVVLGAVVTTLLVNSMGAFIFDGAPSLTEQLAWGIGLTVPLVVRRRFPAAVVLIVAVVFVAAQIRENGDNLIPSIALFFAIYTLGAWGGDRMRARWVRIGVIVAMFCWLGYSLVDSLQAEPDRAFPAAAGPLDPVLAATLYSIGFNLLFFLSAYFFGSAGWESARRRYELELQGEQLRQSQEENARQAVIAERLRIARDLHDVVAHHVSVMGVQATAARRVLASDYDLASNALGAVERTARTAVTELRGLLGVLRTDPHGRAESGDDTGSHLSSPGLEQLPHLVAEAQSAGLQVDYAVYGEPRTVPDALALSAYRIVQEALTNTVKHAAASNVALRVRFLEYLLEIDVADDGRGRPPSRAEESGGGLGLLGMRERVAVHGGELEVGPRAGGGFMVRARMPLAPDADNHHSAGELPQTPAEAR
ncbi:sensor histidine kinase [Phytoactinopolyspora mesophila]|uniref:histidine kinase n=1 Tax=Phytoactinopolyspora mesophila TaxID=2650750 RepID=A0A7K3MB12_9ACTN|nr:histidine kinase [Phytoactinopolyspora mesophila]NDL60473.1 sensor histidine kinase [Phytoactinopolyspora mesophila]